MTAIVLLCPDADDAALDRCLAALDRSLAPGTRVWIADNAHTGPRSQVLVKRWLASSPLQGAYTRRSGRLPPAAHLADALNACGQSDVVVLAADCVPAPGWLRALEACLRRDAAIATATPWCNAGETAAWPRLGEIGPMPDDLDALGRAAGAMPCRHPELPAAVDHAVLLRGAARAKAGPLDGESFGSPMAALIDYSLRLAGLGWRNALCETAFVARDRESRPEDGDMDALAVRWPQWTPRLADFLMQDPLHALRNELQQRLDGSLPVVQDGLFDESVP